MLIDKIVPLRFRCLWILVAMVCLSAAQPKRCDADQSLHTVGVLGNTSGLNLPSIPYAFYTGIAADAAGRLYLAGAAGEIPVVNQDGQCLALVTLPDIGGMTVNSLLATAGTSLFCVATLPQRQSSALYGIDTTSSNAAGITATKVLAGDGAWAISPTPDKSGRVLVGESMANTRKYAVVAIDPVTRKAVPQFVIRMPAGVSSPWFHTIQAEPDGTVSIFHKGGVDFNGRYTASGQRVGDGIPGQMLNGARYTFGYDGQVTRMDAGGTTGMPGLCANGGAPEVRLPAQLAIIGNRHFFAGRGGAVEAAWDGNRFTYQRRIGAIYVEDFCSVSDQLQGVAYTSTGSGDVEQILSVPKAQPIGQLLNIGQPLYSQAVLAVAPDSDGLVLFYGSGAAIRASYSGPTASLAFDIKLADVKSVGQATTTTGKTLFCDPQSGIIWQLVPKANAPQVSAWLKNRPGVVGIAVGKNALYTASATGVQCWTADGGKVLWTSSDRYQGVRRLAVSEPYLYVCDTVGSVVDQLDSATGKRLSRLGQMGVPGSSLSLLDHPVALAADTNGVYIGDNGNGRIVIATSGTWTPVIALLPRPSASTVAGARVPVVAPANARISVNIYNAKGVTVRQLVCGQPSSVPIYWDGKDMYGRSVQPGVYTYNGIVAPKLSLSYKTSIGQSGTPPYRTADGKGSWGGVWGNAMDVCPITSAPDSDIVALWAFEEGEGGLIRMSQDGQVRWKQHLSSWMKATHMALASDGTNIYVAACSAMGAPQGQSDYSGTWSRPMLWRVNAATGNMRLYAADQQMQPMFGDYKQGDRIVTALSAIAGKLYLTAPAQGRLFTIDPALGKAVGTWSIADVSGVAAALKGHLYVGSGTKILEFNGSGQQQRVVADVRGEIWALKSTPNGGVAATVGAPRNQVVYLDASGKEVSVLGRAGGRPLCGKMDPESFLDPTGCCLTGSGKLFVAENTTPRRFTRWSAQGKLEKEFDGPYYMSGMFGVDDEQPEYVYADTHGDIIRYHVDYQTGNWSIDSYWIGVYQTAGQNAKWWPRIYHRDGRLFYCGAAGGIVELRDHDFRSIATIFGGWVQRQSDGNYAPVAANTGLKGTWSDLNGDGKVQYGEWQVTNKPVYPIAAPGPQQYWGVFFDQDFNAYMPDWSDNEVGGIWQIPAAGWANDVPYYRWDQAKHVGAARGNGLQHGANGARTAFAAGGAVYGFNGGYNAANLPGVGHGLDWEFAQITKYNALTGQPIWNAGERASSFALPGQTYCPTGAGGLVGEYLFWTDEGSLVNVWDDRYGLYVDTLLEDLARNPVPSPYTVWVELFSTRVFRHPVTGKVYLLAGSDAIHVYEVQGLAASLQRFQGSFQVDSRMQISPVPSNPTGPGAGK